MKKENKLSIISLLCLLLAFSFSGFAQPPLYKTPAYINHYSEVAIEQMIEFKIPASVIMAQAICESNCGTSLLASKANNHFGIKCHVGWQGDTILKTDDEAYECFRSYSDVRESYTDHSLFLKNRPRYASLFSIPLNDYKAWCKGLKLAGYATKYSYAEELIRLIEYNKLYELDGAEILISGIYQSDQKVQEIKKTKDLMPLVKIDQETIKWFFTDLNKIKSSEIDVLKPEVEMLIDKDGTADTGDIAGSEN